MTSNPDKFRIMSFSEFLKESFEKEPDTQYGSNEGGIHRDTETGERHYVKHYTNADQAKVEALSDRIYQHMGIHTLGARHQAVNGKPSVVTKWNPDLKQMKPHEFENLSDHQANQIGRMYHAAVLTKNWDSVGLVHDNILRNSKTGDLHAADTGGTFHFRARGSHKDYDPEIGEHQSLRRDNPQSAHVYNHVFKHHPDAEREGLRAVKGLDDEKIHQEFKNSGLSNWKELHSNFMARKKKLLAKYE